MKNIFFNNFINTVQNNAILAVTITLGCFVLANIVCRKMKLPILHPLIVASFFLAVCLIIFKIDYKVYDSNTKIITAILSPATVALALPIYRKLEILKKNYAVILISISIGVTLGLVFTFILSRIFNISKTIFYSIITKSVTTPIAIELAAKMGGLRSIAILGVIISGMFGALFGPFVCRIFNIESPFAVGLALGTASHALGTSKAIELGETEGAMSGLAIGVAGIITVIFLPILMKVLMLFA